MFWFHSVAQLTTSERVVTAAQQGAAEVYLKVDFDTRQHPFSAATEVTALEPVEASHQGLTGHSLHVRRVGEGNYLGASAALRIKGAGDLKVGFVVRANGMQHVTVNLFDSLRKDNTTPASPARVGIDWRPVLFGAEDFHYNSEGPDRKIAADTDFTSLLLHGRESGRSAEFWVDKLVVYRGNDKQPPDPPTDLRIASEAGHVMLTWAEPADNTFAVIYSIYRKSRGGDWFKIGESMRATFRDRPPLPDTYAYRVTAADFENNVSEPAAAAAITVDDIPIQPSPQPLPPQTSDRVGYAESIRGVHARGAGRVRADVFLFAGDSNTAAAQYVHVLGSWLGRGLHVRQGTGTVTAAYGADHIKRYLSDARPEFAVIMYGTNDVERGIRTESSMRSLADIADACMDAGTVPVLATIPPRGFDKNNQQGPHRYNRALVQLARDKRIPVSYAFEEIMRRDLREVLHDGIHLHPQHGNEAAGLALRETMDQVYFALRDQAGKQW